MKNLLSLLFSILMVCFSYAQSNIGMGTDTPHVSAKLEIYSKSQGLLLPRMTCAERDAIVNPANGLMLFITDTCTNGDPPGFFYYSAISLVWKPVVNINITNTFTDGNTLDEAYDEGLNPGDGRSISADAGAVEISSMTNVALNVTQSGTANAIDVSSSGGSGVSIDPGVGRGLEVLNIGGVNNGDKDLIYSEYNGTPTSDPYALDGHPGYFKASSSGNKKAALRAITLGEGSAIVGSNEEIPTGFNTSELPPNSGILGVSFTSKDHTGVSGISKVGYGAYGRTEKVNTWSDGPTVFRSGLYSTGNDIGAPPGSGAATKLYIGAHGDVPSGMALLGTNNGGGHGVVGITRASGGIASQAGVWALTQDISGWPIFSADYDYLDATATSKGAVAMLAQSKDNIGVWTESQTDIGLVTTTGTKKGVADITQGNSALYAISTQSDASSGIFSQEGASVQPAVQILSNSDESALYINEIGNGMGLHISNGIPPSDSSSARSIFVENFNEGNNVEIRSENPDNTGAVLVATTVGLGKAGSFTIEDNDMNMEQALFVQTKGKGGAALFKIDDNDSGPLMNMSPAVAVINEGKAGGVKVEVMNGATSGPDVNSEPGLEVTHTGMGNSGLFTTTNASNTSNGVDIAHAGTAYSLNVEGENAGLDAIIHAERAGLASSADKGMVAHFDYKPTSGINKQAVLISSGMLAGTDHAAVRVTAGISGTLALAAGIKAAVFEGNVEVGGILTISDALSLSTVTSPLVTFSGGVAATSLAAPTKAFLIDHPLDQENKKLKHLAIESYEYLNLYTGTAKTDASGFATVEFPDYFTALNKDFRYNLTVVGKTFAQAIIWEEMNEKGTFIIKTDQPNIKVSWQVTGVRQDQFAIENPLQVEQEKTEEEKGKSLWGLELRK